MDGENFIKKDIYDSARLLEILSHEYKHDYINFFRVKAIVEELSKSFLFFNAKLKNFFVKSSSKGFFAQDSSAEKNYHRLWNLMQEQNIKNTPYTEKEMEKRAFEEQYKETAKFKTYTETVENFFKNLD